MQAIPIMNEALAALDIIKEADITYIKKLGNPPAAIKLVRTPGVASCWFGVTWCDLVLVWCNLV